MKKNMIITGSAFAEITEKKSRFIAGAYEIHSEEEAAAVLESVRKKYYDARHNCFAYVLGSSGDILRFSDDKEPQGTAGKPILDVIKGNSLTDVLVIVTRYFGGVLLGTGGLQRAYTQAASEAIKNAFNEGLLYELISGFEVCITCSYSFSGKLQFIFSNLNIPVKDTIYDKDVTFVLAVSYEQADELIKKVTDVSNASCSIKKSGPSCFIIKDGRPVDHIIDRR